ncbi:beta-N-acetylglucosaminidase-domain-containing protein [Penicillium argentinense]|uniref:Beta-N-acetylglucosaminidase-domain-containing protein n=1 Tax=Penicillium argentinense TaxID=1131581 RepID=A0A9W9FNS5_9EURO|nr:beta-N-acetylglucosaminidase-domain-containing protein [Penicillium argentinense]KAJ5103602.1 beta-N-acetylglucosaminidase-domain-containing protein [Penicillium argentinense]
MMYPHNSKRLGAFLVGLLALGPAIAAPTHQLPEVWPSPQEISSSGKGVSLDGTVTIVTGNDTDAATIKAIKSVVSSAGGKAVLSSYSSGHGTQIVIGTGSGNPAAAAIATALAGKSANGLTADGYVLASGQYKDQPSIVLNGVDKRGIFYASQTLRQLVDGQHVPGIKVRDWPLMSIRGSIEGFYGVPWSHQARLDQLVFYGMHKLNTYIYTPKDDPLLRAKWRTLYEGDDLKQLEEIVSTANTNHVDFTFALSPGNDLCYSSDSDFNATITKFNQAHNLGVRSFYIAFDDIPEKLHCDSDQRKWNKTGSSNANDYKWLADAQAYYLNRIQKEYIKPKGLKDLETVPTNYAGSAPDPYKEEFGTQLNKNISIQWTGEGVFSDQINDTSVQRADKTYVTDKMFLWDNFPVNDGNRDRLFLNPLTGRAPNLYKYLLGFTSNPMEQAYASMPALANYADYTWNGPKYDANKSMDAILWELSGTNKTVHNALLAFVDLNQNWPYREPEVYAPQLSSDIAAFWASRNGSSKYHNAESALRTRLALISTLPDVLPSMAMKGFAADVEPWSIVAMQWAKACQHLISMLNAIANGNKKKADSEFNIAQEWVTKTNATTVDDRDDDGKDLPNSITPTTGDGVFEWFLGNATVVYKGE